VGDGDTDPAAMSRVEYYNDPGAPQANSLIPAASAIITDGDERILMTRRSDNSLWTIPGGAMEPGESIVETAIREAAEETGITIKVVRMVGVYSNPNHVVAYDDGEVRQQFSICFAATPLAGTPTTSAETSEVRYIAPADLDTLDIHPSIRLRIDHFLERRPDPYLG
jgi:ADP-ribose pyrophosphatase YjhB (NUDIX family)